MHSFTKNNAILRQLGLNSSNQLCIFNSAGDTEIVNLEKPTQACTEVALTDADAVLTGAQMADSKIFVITPGAARNLTTDTAVNIVAAVPGWRAGLCFEIDLIVLAAYNVTLLAGAGVTIKGSAVVNNNSGIFRCRIDSDTAVTIYRRG